jgi:thiol-disulfide isomerase/thioredoxin
MRVRSALAFATVALIGAAVGVFYYLSQSSAPQTVATRAQPFAAAAKPRPIPELQFEDAASRVHSLADFHGKLVLLNLWATWCAPCREEMPALDRLQAELGGPRFEVVALSVDQQGLEVARKFFSKIGVKALSLYIDRSAQAAFKLGVVGLPATLLVDARGQEIGRHIGPAKWDSPDVVGELRRRIEGTER